MTLENTLRQVQKSKFWQNKKMLLMAIISLFLNLLTWSLVLVRFWNLKQPVALHTNIFFGVDSVGPWHKLLILPLLGLAILIVHFILVFYFYILRRENLAALLANFLLPLQTILLISVLLIVNL